MEFMALVLVLETWTIAVDEILKGATVPNDSSGINEIYNMIAEY